MKWLFVWLLLPVLLFAHVDISVSNGAVTNAGTLLLKLRADNKEPKMSRIYAAFEGKRYPFYRDKFSKGRTFYALIPVSYYANPKESRLVVVRVENGKKQYRSYLIDIYKGDYRSEKLHVAPSRAKISPKNRRRIARERKEAMRIYKTSTPKLWIRKPIAQPLSSKITSPFGTKRVFNGVLKSFHSGTDYRAKTGTPIRSVADGRVVLVKNRFFAGNSVIIDHGQGIYTGYYHLSRFKVHKGELVKRGQVIGLAGATGRVTGPHLHFTAHVNGMLVDPLQFIDTFNGLFEE